MTATSYKVLGIPMQRQSARRKLVVITYALLAMLCCSTFIAHFIYGIDALLPYDVAIFGSMAVGGFVFGGNGWFGGRWGLVKPFANKPPRAEPPMVTLVKLQMEPESLLRPDESGWKNDERELERRDRAHYQAYQGVSFGVVAILLLTFWSVMPKQRVVSADVLRNVLFLVALMTTVLVVTLPSAIILWTEPDIDLG
jgi:hypothetical protein